MSTITLKNGHGVFTVTEQALDLAIQRHLPTTLGDLRVVLDQTMGGDNESRYDDVCTIAEMLVMLADPIQGEIDTAAVEQARNNAHLGGAGMESYDTFLGQVWADLGDGRGERWADFARSTKGQAKAWFEEDPRNRRVVDWIDKDRVIFGS